MTHVLKDLPDGGLRCDVCGAVGLTVISLAFRESCPGNAIKRDLSHDPPQTEIPPAGAENVPQIDDKTPPEGTPAAPFTPAGGSPLTDRLKGGRTSFERNAFCNPAYIRQAKIDQAVYGIQSLLSVAGYDPKDPALVNTPIRFVQALLEMADGPLNPDTPEMTDFAEDKCDEMIVVRGIRFAALCPHHLFPYFGTADVAYLPNPEAKRVYGLSKLARVVRQASKYLVTQEGLTANVADCLLLGQKVKARGVGVRLTATHTCMGVRGACQPDALTVTTALRGAFKEDPSTRAEFLNAIRSN